MARQVMLLNKLFYAKISQSSPLTWGFIYLAPKEVAMESGERSNSRISLEKGKPELFVYPS